MDVTCKKSVFDKVGPINFPEKILCGGGSKCDSSPHLRDLTHHCFVDK